MWRAFFLSIGIILILSGLECLVVGRFAIAKKVRVPSIIAKHFGDAATVAQTKSQPPSTQIGMRRYSNQQVAPPQYSSYYGGSVSNNGSQFGPSRFTNRYGNQTFGRSQQVSQFRNTTPNSQFSLAGYGTNSQPQGVPSVQAQRPIQILQTKDWMPWSLAALGVIIVLYTNSLTRNGWGNNEG